MGVVILGGARTPIGAYRGSLSALTAPQLGSVAIRAALERSGVSPSAIDEVYMGQVVQAGAGGAPGRQAAIGAGVPSDVTTTTVNKMCGSGLKTVMIAAAQIEAGLADLVVAGGMESMSNAPFLVRGARGGLGLGDQQLEDANLRDGLIDAYGNGHMGKCTDDVAAQRGLSRDEQDEFAFRSYERALRAQREGDFAAEIVPVEVPQRKGPPTVVKVDETPRETSRETLAGMKPAFKKDGTITAGNASKVNDGAAAVIVASEKKAAELSRDPIARIVAQAQFARNPVEFILAPAGAIRRVLDRAGWKVSEVDLFEVNEAFSAIDLVRRDIGIPVEKFNVNGG
ncbi:MAG: acetyl-CoA C-acyltransferase, partial [Chloroflexi bacterium]|nr:acetyl-CoA C-acyltransferase [Chloroflexota bacterium]